MFAKTRQLFAVAVLSVLLSACQTFGFAAPQSLPDRIAYAYGVNAAVAEAASNSYENGTLDRESASYVLKISVESTVALDAVSIAYRAGDIQTAEGRLAVTLTVLGQLQEYLRSKGVN